MVLLVFLSVVNHGYAQQVTGQPQITVLDNSHIRVTCPPADQILHPYLEVRAYADNNVYTLEEDNPVVTGIQPVSGGGVQCYYRYNTDNAFSGIEINVFFTYSQMESLGLGRPINCQRVGDQGTSAFCIIK